jgi:hypothetical protein
LLRQTGWQHKIALADGLASTYQSFLSEVQGAGLRAC